MIDALPCKLIGMSCENMNDYIEYVADGLLINLGYKKFYNTSNPFEFMNSIGLSVNTNFFEARVSTYAAAYGLGRQNTELKIVDDF